MKAASLFAALLLLAGCSSDVEKCVDAQMTEWKMHPDQFTIKNDEEARALFYRVCMQPK